YGGYPDTLWHNEGDGTFTDASVSSGIRSAGREPGRGVAFCDFDNDGDADIHVSNYRIRPNFLWQNDGTGHFTNVAPQKGVTGDDLYYQGYGPYYGHTIGSSWADWNNDGYMDIWEANLVHKYVGGGDIRGYICDDSKFYRNNGPPSWDFTDVRPETTIPTKPVGGMGTFIGDELYDGIAWADFDNDGDLDVFMPQVYDLDYAYSYLYINRGDGTFEDVGPSLGLRVWNTYGAAWADYDNDGDLDLVTGGKNPSYGPSRIHLFENSGNSNGWLKVQVEGTMSNVMGLGTRVTVVAGNTTMTRDFEGGTGSHAQMNDLPVEFGMGKAEKADTVIVSFPSGNVLTYIDVPVNTTLMVKEVNPGTGVAIDVSDAAPWEDENVTISTTASAATTGTYSGYYWDIDGNGVYETRTTGPSINTTWTQRGIYRPSLAVARTVAAVNFVVIADPVTVDVRNVVPTAVAGDDVTIGEEEVLVLNGSGSYDSPSDLDALQYRWEVDGVDRGWSNDSTTNVSWPESGTHLVSLVVRDDDGSVHSDSAMITVVNRAPIVSHPGDQTVNEDQQVLIHTTATDAESDMLGIRYRIRYGDGNATGWMQDARRTYVYRDAGVWTVQVEARDGDGAVGSVLFNITVLNVEPTCLLELEVLELDEDEEFSVYGEAVDTQSDLETLKWRFDFGDGEGNDWRYRPIQRTYHAYENSGTFTVTLYVIDDDGAASSESGTVDVVNPPPTASLTGPTSAVDEDEEVDLTAHVSDTISDVPGLQVQWDLGDGTEIAWSATTEVSHSFSKAGTYVVEIQVRDDDGVVVIAQHPVKVENRAPIAEGTQSATSVLEGTTVVFDATGTRDTPGDMEDLSIEWSMGSEVKTGTQVEFQFDSKGAFTVLLTVTDDDGAIAELFFTVNVRNQAPDGIPSVDRQEAKVGQIFNFAALDIVDTSNDIEDLVVTWSFGDGTLDTGVTVVHRYDDPGDYTVTMTIRDDDGAKKEAMLYVTVTEEEGMLSGSGTTIALAAAAAAVIIGLLILFVVKRAQLQEEDAVDGEVPDEASESPNDSEDDEVDTELDDEGTT
ncbi:MAG: PKD domain-containing protein, partial [Thermoplasmata archaeon]